MAREIDRLVTEALHKTAVPHDHIGKMIHQLVAETRVQHALGQSHTHSGCQALGERPGGRFDSERVAILRVAGGSGA